MTEFRKEPGERIRDVYKLGRSYEITKGGKSVALLVPIPDPKPAASKKQSNAAT